MGILKECKSCTISKDYSSFGKCKAKPDGLMLYCKDCYRTIRKEYSRNHREYNLEKHNESTKKWRKQNPWYNRSRVSKRRFLKTKGKLGNSFDSEINKIYKDCPEGYQVDHIIPINHPDVCGLHVPWNLQYLTPIDNIKKSNKLLTTYIDNATSLTVSSDINNQAVNEDCPFFNNRGPNA